MHDWQDPTRWRLGIVEGFDIAPHRRTVPVWGWAGTVLPGGSQQPGYDMHYPLEFGFLLSGGMRRYYRNWQVDLSPGTVWLCGMWERHGWEVTKTPCRHAVLHVIPTALMNSALSNEIDIDWLKPFRVSPDLRPQTTNETSADMVSIGQRVFTMLLAEENPYQTHWLMLLIQEALLTLRREWSTPVVEQIPSSTSHAVINRAVELIFSSSRLVTVQAAAKACGLSRNAFSAAFVGMTGISFPKFALRYRVSRAASQLRQTNDPVKAVAYSWGFASPSHLRRCFYQHYGCSPDAYRRQPR